MLTVQVDGNPFVNGVGVVKTMNDLVELVKATIDPDTIITDMSFEGRELTDADWRTPLAAHRDKVLEIVTGTREEYVAARLELAAQLVDRIQQQFAKSRESFQNGLSMAANGTLSEGLRDLQMFLNWYQTILSLLPVNLKAVQGEFSVAIEDLKSISEQLLQQQLYQSWWAIGETLEHRLEPALYRLRSLCANAQLRDESR